MTEHEHTWTCGCGWRNGVNLATCATCGRNPGGDNPCTQDEDCIHAAHLTAAEARVRHLEAAVETLRERWRTDALVADSATRQAAILVCLHDLEHTLCEAGS